MTPGIPRYHNTLCVFDSITGIARSFRMIAWAATPCHGPHLVHWDLYRKMADPRRDWSLDLAIMLSGCGASRTPAPGWKKTRCPVRTQVTISGRVPKISYYLYLSVSV